MPQGKDASIMGIVIQYRDLMLEQIRIGFRLSKLLDPEALYCHAACRSVKDERFFQYFKPGSERKILLEVGITEDHGRVSAFQERGCHAREILVHFGANYIDNAVAHESDPGNV